MLLEAWQEAGEIAKAQYQWTRFNKYQRALDLYIGKESGQLPILGRDHIWGKLILFLELCLRAAGRPRHAQS